MVKQIVTSSAKTILAITITLVVFIVSVACKTAILGPTYPIDDFSEYDCIVVATINKAAHSKQGYRPLKTFKATIIKSLKGNLKIGDKISGKAKKEEPRAVCPVHLTKKSDYLLLLTHTENGYELSRFSFPVKKEYHYFNNYIQQIEKILASKTKKQ